MSVTLEDADFLYALVRITRPALVIEIGSGLGVSGRFIAEALRDNGHGRLDTYEPLKEYADQARRLLDGLPATVTHHVDPDDQGDADIVYIDNGGPRGDTIRRWLTCGHKGLVVVHDANRGYDECGLYGDGVLLPGQDGFWIGKAKCG